MALNQIPFYASLLGRYMFLYEIGRAQLAQRNHVLVYGAVEAHDRGPKGCIASNKTIAAETGFTSQTVANALADLSKAGWITVALDNNNQRTGIKTNLTLTVESNPPYSAGEPPLTLQSNIDKHKKISERNAPQEPSVSFDGTVSPPGELPPTPAADPPTTNKLHYDVIKKYALPVSNHLHVGAKSKAFDAEIGPDAARVYLQRLLDVNYTGIAGDFKPELNHSRDIYNKRIQITKFLDEHTPRGAAISTRRTPYEISLEREKEREKAGGWGF